MATGDRRKGSRLGGMFRMMKSMRKCMTANGDGLGCAGMMERFASSGEGFDCEAMMKAAFGTQSAKPEETATKA